VKVLKLKLYPHTETLESEPAMKTLAKINPQRDLNFTDEQHICLRWDDHEYTMSYDQFVAFVETLQAGVSCDYADCAGCAFVRVDEGTQEVWLADKCLLMSAREFRALLNAALSTKTRLYGIMRSLPERPDPLANVKMRAVGPWQAPRQMQRSLN
jgi:hypothetical protein